MTEFSTTGQLELDLDDRSLRGIERDIERGLSDIEVGMDSSTSSMLANDVESGSFGTDDTLQAAILETLDDIHEEIKKLGTSMAGGSGGGGGLPFGGFLAGRYLRGGVLSSAGGLLSKLPFGRGGLLAMGQTPGSSIRDRSDIGPGARGLSGIATGLRKELQSLNLPDVKLTTPRWLQDLDLQVPTWLENVSVDVPNWLRNPPSIGFDVPAPLRGLLNLGGDSATSTSSAMQRQRPFDRELFSAARENRAARRRENSRIEFGDLTIRHNMPGVERTIENAVANAFKSGQLDQQIVEIVRREIKQ